MNCSLGKNYSNEHPTVGPPHPILHCVVQGLGMAIKAQYGDSHGIILVTRPWASWVGISAPSQDSRSGQGLNQGRCVFIEGTCTRGPQKLHGKCLLKKRFASNAKLPAPPK